MSELCRYLPGIVLINPGIIAGKEPTISGHFVVVKEVGEDRVVINDPDPLYGGEDKKIDLDIFIRAWRIMSSWIIQVKKRRKDE